MNKILGLSAIGALMGIASVAQALPSSDPNFTTNAGFEDGDLSFWQFDFPGGGNTNTVGGVVVNPSINQNVPSVNGVIPPSSYSPFSADFGNNFLALRTPDDQNDGSTVTEGPHQVVSRVFALDAGETLQLDGVIAFDWGEVFDLFGNPAGPAGADAAKVTLETAGGGTETLASLAGDVTVANEDWQTWAKTIDQAGSYTLSFIVYNTVNNKDSSLGLFDLKTTFTPATTTNPNPNPNPNPAVPEPGTLALLGLGLAGLGYGRRRVRN